MSAREFRDIHCMERPTASNCFVEFVVRDEPALVRLAKVVEELRHQKANDAIADEAHWLPYFEAGDRSAFWWPDEAEMNRWNKFWFSTPLPERHQADMPTPPWNFESLIFVIMEGDYDLIGITRTNDSQARLTFKPNGFPYGGINALRELIRSFGHEITGFDDGTGFVGGDPQSPRWNPNMEPPNPRK
ncbi:hypothetical protein [Rhizobium herbae]|uniref:YubB ferredoxin-like domain-containing protein n=1 Tax=Rhizobium herbae TaxID=508661 RepID=A0ABS4ELS8_9HYPH|nr:hypothetical protein [Rhizobium herbae]MBP1858907.1 hypothetical protein [Rhizobium herbae]